MHGYGLKPCENDDVEEGHAVIKAFREADQEAWEDKQQDPKNRGR